MISYGAPRRNNLCVWQVAIPRVTGRSGRRVFQRIISGSPTPSNLNPYSEWGWSQFPSDSTTTGWLHPSYLRMSLWPKDVHQESGTPRVGSWTGRASQGLQSKDGKPESVSQTPSQDCDGTGSPDTKVPDTPTPDPSSPLLCLVSSMTDIKREDGPDGEELEFVGVREEELTDNFLNIITLFFSFPF